MDFVILSNDLVSVSVDDLIDLSVLRPSDQQPVPALEPAEEVAADVIAEITIDNLKK